MKFTFHYGLVSLDDQFISSTSNDTWGVGLFSRDYLANVLQREKNLDERIHEWQSLVERDELLQHVVAMDNMPPFHVAYTVLQLDLNITKFTLSQSHDVTLGTCLPRSCSPEDVISIVNFSIMLNDNLKTNATTARTIRIRSLRQVEATYDLKNDLGAVLIILITIVLVLLTVIATIVDLDLVRMRPYPVKSITFDMQKYNNTNIERDRRFINEFTKTHVSEVLQESKEFGKKGIELHTLAIKNIHNSNSGNATNVVVQKPEVTSPSITLDVMNAEGALGSCTRCGKYKKQCSNPRQLNNLGPCPRIKYNSSTSLTTDYNIKINLFKNLLVSFSLRHSWQRIFNTSMANKDLSAIHTLRILATLWIIFVHTSVIAYYLAENGGSVSDYNNAYYIINSGTLAFDTLMFVSGLFSAHHFFYLKSHYTVEELVSCGGLCGQAMQVICFVTNRVIRLLPPYIYTIFVAAATGRVWRDTAPLALPERDHYTCDAYWWRNALYVTNFYPREQQCLQISWYLSTETQLHVVGAFLCLLLATARWAVGAALVVAVVVASVAFDVTAAFTDYSQRMTSAFGMYATVVSRPLARVAPYMLGVAGGWLVQRASGRRLTVSKITSWCFWFASALTLIACITVPWLQVGWPSAWLHLMWPLALLWPTLVFSTKYSQASRRALGGARAAALGRLAYCALLLHGGAARALLPAAPPSARAAGLFCYLAGTSALTLLGSLALCLLVEMPCCCLLTRISNYIYS